MGVDLGTQPKKGTDKYLKCQLISPSPICSISIKPPRMSVYDLSNHDMRYPQGNLGQQCFEEIATQTRVEI
jgi:hypothetical protein